MFSFIRLCAIGIALSLVGASGNIGTENVARAPADGYTMLINTLPLVVNPSMYRNLPFDVVKDFAPVSLLAAAPFVLAVHPSVPAKSVKELVALAQSRPGKLNYASAGNGTNLHVAAELFKHLTHTDIVHIPYKGGGPALTAVIASSPPEFGAHIKNELTRWAEVIKAAGVRAD